MSDASDAVPSLERLGFGDRWRALFAPMAEEGFVVARVMRVDRGIATVGTGEALLPAEPAAHLLKTSGTGSRFAVGDWVALAGIGEHDHAIIEAILPRKSAFIRKDPGERDAGQVVAANIDYIFIVQVLSAKGPNLRRLERELVLAWDSGATPVVVLTKLDLVEDADEMRAGVEAITHGVDVHVVSGITGENVEGLRGYTRGNATVAVFGASGVGKSTLINHLVGAEVQETQEIRESDGRGRHTTVAREMVFLPGGGVLIDTPGMRALALWDSEDGIAAAFPDIEALARECRFRDCVHVAEPGCAVLAAKEAGILAEERLASYHRLLGELEANATRADARARGERDRDGRILSKTIKRYFGEHPGKRDRG